ncbi:MAG: NUDIX domain-containing protein [Candidatus Thorarchaeota archaeon]
MNQRRYPKSPIPSVAVIIVGSKGILLIKRDKPPYEGLWNIVSGTIQVGETQEEAVVREVREETGIEGEVVRFVDTGDVIVTDSEGQVEFHYLVNVYLFRASTDEYIINEGSDIRWFHPSDIPVHDMVDSVSKALKKLEKHLEQVRLM